MAADMRVGSAAELAAVAQWLREAAPGAELVSDSRRIGKGDIFIAYPHDGGNLGADGRSHIAHAISQGAAAVVYEDGDGFTWNAEWKAHCRPVRGLQSLAGSLANLYYNRPDVGMFTVGVTGTNGKTSCSQWLGQALSGLGSKTAVIGTLGVGMFEAGRAGEFEATGYTTPDAVQLQRRLAQCRTAGASALAIEASSIGLHQRRLNGLHFDVALFTNFTRDHLDYHGDMQSYEAAKTMLFDWPGLRHAVVNLDDEMGMRLVHRLKRSPVTVTGYTVRGKHVDGIDILSAANLQAGSGGSNFHLDSKSGSSQVKTQLVGEFNVSNVLGVIGVLLAADIPWRAAIEATAALTAAPGRMQQLGGQDTPLVVIDYAHTPDALEKALHALRQAAQQRGGRLWCVFGCGGDRDPGKRPQMGAAAAAGADHLVVTSDNPRSEDPAAIIDQIVAGIDAEQVQPNRIEDRASAILWAIKHAARQDVILLAGKGHENYQETNGKKLPFLDADHAALALSARATMKGTG